MNIRPYTNMLRKLGGWTKDYAGSNGGWRLVEFSKQVDQHRILMIQLWEDGEHRVNFSHDRRQATLPTDFRTVDEMVEAIKVELVKEPAPRV